MLAYYNLLVGIWEQIKLALLCSVDLLHMLFGKIDLKVLRSPLSIDKIFNPTCSCICVQLRVSVNTINLRISVLFNKHKDLASILLTIWIISHKRLKLREVALRLVSSLALSKQWFKYTHVFLQHVVPLALKFNSNTLLTSGKYKYQRDLMSSNNVSIKNFFL